MVAVVGLFSYGGCEDVGSDCHPSQYRLGEVALIAAVLAFGSQSRAASQNGDE
jgi:hypothetical protein